MKRHKQIKLEVRLTEAAGRMLDVLVKEGTYGERREQVARRIIEERLNLLQQVNPLWREA